MGRIFTGGFQLRLRLLDVHKHFCQSDWYVVSNLHMISVIIFGNVFKWHILVSCFIKTIEPGSFLSSSSFYFLFLYGFNCDDFHRMNRWFHNCYWIPYKARSKSFGLDLERGSIGKAFLVAHATSFTNWQKRIISTKKTFLST